MQSILEYISHDSCQGREIWLLFEELPGDGWVVSAVKNNPTEIYNLQQALLSGGLRGGTVVKNLSANAGPAGSILGWEDPLEKGMATHSSTLAGKSRGQRSLAGYSPWGCKD